MLTVLHPEKPKLHTILAFLSVGFRLEIYLTSLQVFQLHNELTLIGRKGVITLILILFY